MFTQAQKIGRPGAGEKSTPLERYSVKLWRVFGESTSTNQILSLTFREAIRTGAYTGNPSRMPEPMHIWVDTPFDWVVAKVIYSYGIRENGSLSRDDEKLQIRCSASDNGETFTKSLFTIPFTSAPCPPGESRTYSYDLPIAFRRKNGDHLNAGFLLANKDSASIFEYSYESLEMLIYGVNPRQDF